MPDLNSLPPSYLPSPPAAGSPGTGNNSPEALHHASSSSSPRASSTSLAAAATINAGMQNQESHRSSVSSNRNHAQPSERRSNVAMNLNLHDPSLPGPGEFQAPGIQWSGPFRTTSPRGIGSPTTVTTGMPQLHQRAPSLGELHQELEQEQEAQVNRLLEMIRQQQTQLQQLQQFAGYTPSTSTAAVDDSTFTSERSLSFPNVPFPNISGVPLSATNPRPRSPVPRSSIDLSRQSSRRSRPSSRVASPALLPQSAGLPSQNDAEWLLSGGGQSSRDDSAYYQTETQNLTRENQMLRLRVRELEQQLNAGTPASANTPATSSNLVPPSEGEAAGGARTDPSEEDKD